ncbi:MAG: GGDEF domain-containing protein [Candidatus Omnitrophica bacterium]|nr:GGDEF domain-containing protein [Candidatus Omnitrophota bacterium]
MRILMLLYLLFLFLIAIRWCKNLLKSSEAKIKESLESKSEMFNILKKENEEIQNKKKLLDKKSSALSRIYEINKKMSRVLKRKEIVSVFSDFLKDLKMEYREYSSILDSQLALQLKKASLYESVEKLSITDGLTEIYLRRYFIDRLSEEIERSRRLKLKFSILMVDIDHFKNCNDRYGHMVGDAVLREVASIIKSNIRQIDLAARYGGEEFTVLLPETGRDGALHVAERIRKACEDRLISAYDENLKFAVSIGISVYPEDAKDSEPLIEKADEAMYRSKQAGRNRVSAS